MRPLFPKKINQFVDLFAGGGNVGINANAQKVYFNDNLTYLIEMYTEFKNLAYETTLIYIENQIKKYKLFGRNRSCFNETMKFNLYQFITRLNDIDTEFSTNCFSEFDFSELTSKDYVYCDPPYLITTGTYNDGKRGFKGWGINEEKLLLKKLDELT